MSQGPKKNEYLRYKAKFIISLFDIIRFLCTVYHIERWEGRVDKLARENIMPKAYEGREHRDCVLRCKHQFPCLHGQIRAY